MDLPEKRRAISVPTTKIPEANPAWLGVAWNFSVANTVIETINK
jgi:hypothetical protein